MIYIVYSLYLLIMIIFAEELCLLKSVCDADLVLANKDFSQAISLLLELEFKQTERPFCIRHEMQQRSSYASNEQYSLLPFIFSFLRLLIKCKRYILRP